MQSGLAACGGTVRTWAGSTNVWNTASNWSGSNVPNTTSEDVVIISTGSSARVSTDITVGCMDVQSGIFEGTTNDKLTVTGDYFRAPFTNTLNLTSNKFRIEMAGTSAQTFEAVDDIRDLDLSNDTSVTLKNNFRIRSDLRITSTGITYVEGDITLNNTGVNQLIPAGHTVIIKNGGSIFAKGGLTISGVLKVEAGGELRIRRDETLTVSSGGVLQLLGASGNPAKLVSEASNRTFIFIMNGILTANYFTVQRTNASGMSIGSTGTVTQLDNGEFRGIRANGFAISLANGSSLPSTMDTIGFFNDDAQLNPNNFNATSYSGASTLLDNYSGDVSGTSFEVDPSSKINWNVSASTELSLVDDAETGEPQLFIDPSEEFTFAEFAFSLTQNDTITDITQVAITMTGSASISDLEYVRAYIDSNANCNYNSSNDTLIGDLSFSGSPAKAIVNIPTGQIQSNGPSDQGCLIIRAKTTANPSDAKTVKFGVMATSDVTNSGAYSFSVTSSPPVESKMSTIRNSNYSKWEGSVDDQWSNLNNWSGATLPSSSRDCQVGVGSNTTRVNTSPIACANATLQTNGTMNWNNSTFHFEVSNTLNIQSSFNFTNATLGSITMKGVTNQSFTSSTTFPGNLIINNSGSSASNTVAVLSNATFSGNLTCSDGQLAIPNGVTLTILGDVTVQSGCSLVIQSGGTLALGNGRTLTVNTGGTLNIVGNSSNKAMVTTSNSAFAMAVVVNGTINARYYTFDHLATSGVTINAGATINATNHLQDGSFTYPVNGGTTLLNLHRQIPTNALSDMTFDSNGSAAASVTNINTNATGAGTLSITNHSGDLSGSTLDNATSYLISWSGETNTILLTQETSSPGTVTVGGTYSMVRYGFKQSSAGAFSDTDVTSLKITLTGTGTSADITSASIYYDSDCNGTGGSLIGSGTFSGNPATRTFSFAGGQFTVEADAVTPPKRCIYVDYNITSSATGNNTLGVSIAAANDMVNSQGYAFSATTPTPVTSGTPSTIYAPSTTIWTGTTNTDWFTASNWTAGVPSLTKTCQIPNVTNDPTVGSGTATCKNVDITNGVLTISGGATLETYGNFTNTGTLNQTGNLDLADGGSSLNHNITSTSTINTLRINKSGGGTISVTDSSLQINTVSVLSSNFLFKVLNGKKLVLPNGINMSSGTYQLDGGGTIEIGSGQSLQVSGSGLFVINGVNDTFPQSSSNKGLIQPVGGSGTFGITTTGGRISFSGFYFNKLNTSGLNIGGSTIITKLEGGQLTNLSASHSSVRAIQINTSGSIPSSASNIAWTWGNFNSFDPATGNTPASSAGYTLIYSSGCSGQSIDFSGWTGDWYESQTTFDVSTKVNTSSCNVSLSNSQSAVSLENFKATPYDQAIDISWTTILEVNHIGFNLYRSNSPDGGEFKQVNTELIRNLNNAGQARGDYRFIDNGVTNNEFYYYFLEDLEVGGKRTLHGPVYATARSGLGNPPAAGASDNVGTNPDDDIFNPNPGTITNPSYKDLGHGVKILLQTSSTLKLKINPSTAVYTTSLWNGAYETVAITGYSKSVTPTLPELPERELLIEVHEYTTAANVDNLTLTTSVTAGKLIAPAPTFTIEADNSMSTSYSINATTYATSANFPNSHLTLDSDLITIGKRKYIRVKLTPLNFNPVTQDITASDEIIVDINLVGGGINPLPINDGTSATSYLSMNSLKIDIEETGMHELLFTDLLNTYTDFPFDEVNLSELRLYAGENEVPLEITSIDGQFNSGDSLKFFARAKDSIESKTTSLILTIGNPLDEGNSPLRILDFDGTPGDFEEASEQVTLIKRVYEENKKYLDGISLGHSGDHFFWTQIFSLAGWDTFTVSPNLPELDLSSNENVIVNFTLKGNLGQYYGNQIEHHMELYINSNLEDEATFWSNEQQVLSFEIPADRFLRGINGVSLKLLGTNVPNSDLDIAYIDKVEVIYVADLSASSNKLNVHLNESLVQYSMTDFTNGNINIYDTSDSEIVKISNAVITSNAGNTIYTATFGVDDMLNTNDEKELFATTDDAFLIPYSLSLISDYESPLRESDNRGKLLIIGHENLLYAAEELAEYRRSQGMEVLSVSLEQIYLEFSYGSKSSKAIKDFINYAISNWDVKPEYVFILGDGTTDPLDHNIDVYTNLERSSHEVETLPMPLSTGRFQDFGNDNYFVSSDSSHIPKIAIGRLPTNDPDLVRAYIQKVIDFENGDTTPNLLETISFLAGKDDGDFDKFLEKSKEIALKAKASNQNLQTTMTDATPLATDQNIRDEIISLFNNTPLFISMMGHGSAISWGKNSSFTSTNAKALTNPLHPISIMWSCEGAQYFYPEKAYSSIGEELVLNETGGSIIYMGSTTFTTPSAQLKLAQNFFEQYSSETSSVFKNNRIGDIFIQSKLSLGTHEYERDIVSSFSLIGDPTLRLPSSIFAPPPRALSTPAPASGGGGGCSASAADGRTQIPWYFGLMEWLFYLSLIFAFTLGRKIRLKL